MKRTHLYKEIITALLVLLFCYTAFSKLKDQGSFHDALVKSPLLVRYAQLLSRIVPITELMIVITLLIRRTRLYGLYASLALLSLFTFYLLYILLFANHLPCSCGGVISEMNWTQHVVFNLFFIALSITGIILHKKILRNQAKLKTCIKE